MTVLIAVLAVVVLLAAILLFVFLAPLSVRILYDQSLEVYAGVSFLKFKVFPKTEKKKKSKKTRRKKAKTKAGATSSATPEDKSAETDAEKSADGRKKTKAPLSETLGLVFEIIKSVFDVMGRRALIKIDMLEVTVACPEAAETAVKFGLCGGIVSNILAFTSNFGKAEIKDERVFVRPDFVSGKGSLRTDITLSVPAGSLVAGVIRGYLKGITRK